MKKETLSLLAACTLILTSCGQKTIEFKNYDLDAVTTERDINMSDLADDLRVVPLESGKDFIVSSESQNWVNDKYILIFGQNAIEQFSAVDGKHIKTLAIKGGGPDEFDYVVNPVVDDAKQVLYFTKMQSDIIKRIDLNTGKFLSDVELGSKNTRVAGIAPDGRLLIPSAKNIFEYIDPQTGVHEGFQKEIDTTQTSSKDDMTRTVILVTGAGSDFFLNRQEFFMLKDTLYTVDGDHLSKYCAFTFKDEVGKGEFGVEGTSLDLKYVDNNSIMVSLMETRMKIERSGDDITSISINKNEKMKAIIDRKSSEIAKIGKFTVNPSFEYEGALLTPGFFRGSSLIAYPIEAFDLQESIEKALKSGKIASKDKSKLESLSGQLTEDSNPVFIIGTKK